MVSNGRRSGCAEANEKCPAGCQSCVSTTCWNLCASSLITGTTSSPRGTASLPPGQKSFWTSTTSRTSVSRTVIAMPPSRGCGPVSSPPHHGRHQVLDGGRADLLHHGVRLDAQELEHAFDAGLPEGAEAPDIGPPDAHRRRAHAQRLDDIGAAAEAGIDQDRHAALHGLDDLRQRVDGGAAGILAARAVIGDDDAV